MADEPLSIPLADLRRSFDLVLRNIEAATPGDTLALDKDHFWSVPADGLYDVYQAPGELTIGQLSESWQHLTDLLAEPDRAVGYHLVWLADVLRAIGQDIAA
ncbi:hypothetical protein ACFU6K_29630 [Kitasatospora sp. NPDC057512]|uniref:hypothetical protein n=1 Tax=Kitasatospora sp. NPDC057512 TaxID=3346154 RepID=UPI00369AE1F4